MISELDGAAEAATLLNLMHGVSWQCGTAIARCGNGDRSVLRRTLRPGVRRRPVRASLRIARSSSFRRRCVTELAARPGLLSDRPASPRGIGAPLAPGPGRATIDGVESHSENAAMTAQEIAAALQRVEAVLQRRPDSPCTKKRRPRPAGKAARASWRATRTARRMATDMPREFGGAGNDVTPGWLFRAGFASCTATCIAMGAAAQGDRARVARSAWPRAARTSAASSAWRMPRASRCPRGRATCSSSSASLRRASTPQRLRALVEESYCCSPISSAVRERGAGGPRRSKSETT